MFTRISSGGILMLTMVACGGPSGSGTVTAAPQIAATAALTPTPSPTPDDGKVACATVPAADFARSCTYDHTDTSEGLVLTMRHTDGGFHRLLAVTDDRGVIAADGAEAVRVTVLASDEIEAEIGTARYRLSAQVRSPTP
jgi:hypothetical protein